MSDIVERLRVAAQLIDPAVGSMPPRLFNASADEIESLRSQLAEAEKDAQCYHHLVGLIRANKNALAGEVLDWFTGTTTERKQ